MSDPDENLYPELVENLVVDLSSLDAEARARLVTVLQRAIDANCTVGRTLKAGASVELTVTGER